MTFFPWFFRLCQHYQFITDHLFVLQCLPKHISVNEERRCYLICVYIYIICINAYTFNVYIYFHWNIFKINSLITRWFFFFTFHLAEYLSRGWSVERQKCYEPFHARIRKDLIISPDFKHSTMMWTVVEQSTDCISWSQWRYCLQQLCHFHHLTLIGKQHFHNIFMKKGGKRIIFS